MGTNDKRDVPKLPGAQKFFDIKMSFKFQDPNCEVCHFYNTSIRVDWQ